MIAKVLSSAVLGVDAYLVEVEVDIALGFPAFNTVGLPEGAVRESKERVRAAIKNCGYEFPYRRITVNLAPADVRKEGSAFDLPISLGILTVMGLVDHNKLNDYIILGELSLDGVVKPIKGALPTSICTRGLKAKRHNTAKGKRRGSCCRERNRRSRSTIPSRGRGVSSR